jgi:hypothetical protein
MPMSTPISTNAGSSQKRQSLSYETENNTIWGGESSQLYLVRHQSGGSTYLPGPERVERLESCCRDDGCPKAPPEHLWREVGRDLLEREEDTSDRSTEGDRHSSSASGRQDLASLRFIRLVLGEATRDQVADARGNVLETGSWRACQIGWSERGTSQDEGRLTTMGPSFPRLRPDATESVSPTALVKRVHPPR